MTARFSSPDLLAATANIVAAHLSKSAVAASELSDLIEGVYAALAKAGRESEAAARPQPAVPIRKSVTTDYIVCLEDGRRLKMLKRHLMTAYEMTPEDYRARWGLPPDYPMVAPSYAKRRSRLARKIGLGVKTRKRPRRRK